MRPFSSENVFHVNSATLEKSPDVATGHTTTSTGHSGAPKLASRAAASGRSANAPVRGGHRRAQ